MSMQLKLLFKVINRTILLFSIVSLKTIRTSTPPPWLYAVTHRSLHSRTSLNFLALTKQSRQPSSILKHLQIPYQMHLMTSLFSARHRLFMNVSVIPTGGSSSSNHKHVSV